MAKSIFSVCIICGAMLSSCQERTLCKIRVMNGVAYTRLYKNNYTSAEDYQQAIAAMKANGYSCDDSDLAN